MTITYPIYATECHLIKAGLANPLCVYGSFRWKKDRPVTPSLHLWRVHLGRAPCTMVGNAAHQRPLFVLFGASMTQFSYELGGWGAAFQDLYQRKADFLLRGYSGWNTRRALSVLHQIFPKDLPTQPALVVVFFGANDAAVPVPSGKGQAVPIDEFKGNLIKIASYLKGLSDTTRVVLITAPPIHEENRIMHLSAKHGENARKYPDRTNERAGQYAAACKDAASEAGVGVVDLWTAIQLSNDDWGSCLTDGMHLSASGSKVLLSELMNEITNHIDWVPSLHWKSMPEDFSQPSEHDYIHPAQELAK